MLASVVLALLPTALAAPLLIPRGQPLIAGKYIVKFKGDVAIASDVKAMVSATPDFEYGMTGFNGFAGSLSDKELADLQASDAVEWIEQDAEVHMSAFTTQENAPWGLARLSSQNAGATAYTYDTTAGEGTCSYVIDTGITIDHPEFEGRAEFVENTTGDGDNSDAQGHGTHVAGTIGSATYGVAKKTKLLAIKVLDASGSGSNAGVIAGVNAAVQDSKTRVCPKGSVANMSLGGRKNAAVNEAVAAGVADGLFFAVAAGNERGADAGDYSPASEATACTVGATDKSDTIAVFSNIGEFVDIFAPGVAIESTWNDGQTNTISGTSMASPHIAGLAAYLLSAETVATTALCQRIVQLAHKDKITGIKAGTVNLLAFNNAPGAGGNSTVPRFAKRF